MRAFLRIILVIPLGLMAAIIAAVVVYLAAFGFAAEDFRVAPGALLPAVTEPALLLSGVIARSALLPFLVAVALSEILAIRSMLAWILVGGTLGFVLQLVGFPGSMEFLPPVAAGLVAGFAYWLVAGRGAGLASSGRFTETTR